MSRKTEQEVAETRGRIRDLLATGHNPREISKLLDLTTQAVYLHMDALKAAAAAAKAEAALEGLSEREEAIS